MVIFFFSLIALIAGVYIVTNWRKEQHVSVANNTVIKEVIYYNSHCWNCNTQIDSRINVLCPKCKKYYICNNCGKCLCDKKEYNLKGRNSKIKKHWVKTGEKITEKSTSSRACSYCGKEFSSTKDHNLCYQCLEKVKAKRNQAISSTGYCKKCGKKLQGDTSKELCTACWREKNGHSSMKKVYGYCQRCGMSIPD